MQGYKVAMRYRLRTLLVALALAPPVLGAEADLAPINCTFQPIIPVWELLAVGVLTIAVLTAIALIPPMFRFTIRDVLWLTVVVALIVCWFAERRRFAAVDSALREQEAAMRFAELRAKELRREIILTPAPR